jgi:hypothetical protein
VLVVTSLSEKTAPIAAAAQGIGQTTAIDCTRQEVTVVRAGLNEASSMKVAHEIRSACRAAQPTLCDVRSEPGFQALVKSMLAACKTELPAGGFIDVNPAYSPTKYFQLKKAGPSGPCRGGDLELNLYRLPRIYRTSHEVRAHLA